jgi:tetratricopeptide repeat protein 30
MQEVKFKDAIRYYDPIVKRLQESLVDITAIVLANLCVSYIMTSQVKGAELGLELDLGPAVRRTDRLPA